MVEANEQEEEEEEKKEEKEEKAQGGQKEEEQKGKDKGQDHTRSNEKGTSNLQHHDVSKITRVWII